MLELFHKGGPIMWPLLICSLVTLTVVIERVIFLLTEISRRSPRIVHEILRHVEKGNLAAARETAAASPDGTARVLGYALEHRDEALSTAVLHASGEELDRYNRGLAVLDTMITLAPLLGLLGTVTGMIRTFGLLGGAELEAPQAVTGGIAEALIATAFGLGVAITALVPFNLLNSRLERTRRDIEAAASQLELHLK
ncbi:MAG: MotA/TolQ/ExbB proton channel family protein [Verrucomicrobiales bacterium]|nr:MotA/TolQ/ExbB proton channel family protein [Verrucomicrobiales bacterium]